MRRCSRRALLTGAAAAALASGARAAPAALKLRRGVNLWPWFSLTREFPAPRTDYDWPPFQPRRPAPRASDLARLRQAGFDFVRIPVDPGPFLSFAGARRAALRQELAAAVSQCLAADLAVIVNVQINETTHHWNSARLIQSTQAVGFSAYRGLVAGIASDLAAKHDLARVALEPVNEPPQACGSPLWPAAQRALLSAARAAAPGLTLVATGACGSMVGGLEALAPASAGVSGPVLHTFHFYEPYLFTHQGAPWMREPVYRSLNGVPWPAGAGALEVTLDAVRRRMAADTATPAGARAAAFAETERALKIYFDAMPDRRFIEDYFARVTDWAARENIAPGNILLGEFGALRSDARYTAAAAPDRARYIRDVRGVAEASGFAWAFWNLFDGFGIMDEATRALDPAVVSALGLAMPEP